MAPGAPALHEGGNLLRTVVIEHGEADPPADVVVRGSYEVGMQDQAFLGPESGVAVPDGEGGVVLHIATQWLHVDRDQLAESLALAPERVKLVLGGVGGAFGGREDLSMQIHACLLALRTGRPVKMVYGRDESFVGHVHRHPAWMEYEHGAARDGRLVYVKARIVLDGGAYASSSTAVCSNAACFAAGPYAVPNARITAHVVYTDNPPCGAMRGFGAVQVAFAHEAQMDRLAAELGMDPVALRARNAIAPGDALPTGQVLPEPAPVAELLERIGALPLPDPPPADADQRELPGGVANTTHGEGVRRGVGYAVGFKNVGYSEGFDDYSTARVRITRDAEGPLVEVHTAAVEVGQGVQTIQAQIARSELGIERVEVLPADTAVGSAGSTSASRQTYVTGGAVKAACAAVREQLEALGGDPAALERPIEATVEWHHRATHPLDARGQGDAHLQFAFSVHRAVADVDVELGLVRDRRARDRAGGRPRDAPAGARRPDRGRLGAGARARADGGDRRARRRGPQRLVHRLPDPDDARHAARRDRAARARRPRGALRAQGRRRAAEHLDAAGRGGRGAGGVREAAPADAGAARAHRLAAPQPDDAGDAGEHDRDQHDGPDRADDPLDPVVVRAEERAGPEQQRVPAQRPAVVAARKRPTGISASPAGTETRLRTPGTSRPRQTIGTARRSNQPSARSRSASEIRSSGCSRMTSGRPPTRASTYSSSAPSTAPRVAAPSAGQVPERAVRDLEAGEREHELRRDRREHRLDRHDRGDPRVPGLRDGVLDVGVQLREHRRRAGWRRNMSGR